jgi:two-component system, OmpR family, alkaline phosphatase synthesis response regulator PhoP
MYTKRILVVMDEPHLSEKLKLSLLENNYEVDVLTDPSVIFERGLSGYSLVILDVMIGDVSGFKIVRMMKDNPKYAKLPIVFVTAKSTENDRLTGFAVGADDYIVAPFSFLEFLARVKVVIKRYTIHQDSLPKILKYEQLEVDLVQFKVFLGENELELTKREFELLKLFLTNVNKVFSREEILDLIWHDDEAIQRRTIDVNINRLRNRIGEYGSRISTIPGYGYCFEK